MTAEPRESSFDEQAALQELERLQQAIVESRRRRGETVDAFDKFVRSFKGNVDAPVAPPAPTPAVRSTRPTAEPFEPQTEAPPLDAPAMPARFEAPPPDVVVVERRAPRRVPAGGVLIGVAAVAVIGVVALMRTRQSPPVQPAATAHAPAPPATSPPAPVAATAPAARPAGGLQGEITTVRPVWVRVLADGQRAIERELKANERIPVHAAQTLTIRAGDAGALRLSIDGKDQGPLGRDGVIATRTFTTRQPSRAPR